MKKMMMLVMNILIIFVLLSLWGFYSAIRPFRYYTPLTPENFNIPYENISFKTKDNILIKGWFIPAKKQPAKTIILMHGYPADKANILSSRLFLQENYNLLLFDFRYHGESGGHYSTVGKNEVYDLLAAIDYLKKRGIFEVGVWGLSLGGAVAIMTAPKTDAIKVIVSESSYARLDWLSTEYYSFPLVRYPLAWLTQLWAWVFLQYNIYEVSPAKAAEHIRVPILLIHSQQDRVVPIRHGLLLQQSLKHNPHAQFIFPADKFHAETIENYQNIIKKFFSEYLK